MVRLTGAPDRALQLLRERLRPVAATDPMRVAALLGSLDQKELSVRQQSASELEKLGELIEPALREALANQPGLERRKRLEQLQVHLVPGAALPEEELRSLLRAVELLEQIGTEDAIAVLRSQIVGADVARLTQQARRALHRLGKGATLRENGERGLTVQFHLNSGSTGPTFARQIRSRCSTAFIATSHCSMIISTIHIPFTFSDLNRKPVLVP